MFTQQELLDRFGPAQTNKVVERLRRFARIPNHRFEEPARLALSEVWGENHFVLEKYLSAHVCWSIEQNKFTSGGNQFYVTAGHLQTRYGTPIYLVFERNRQESRQSFVCVHAGSDVSAPSLPTPPEIPAPDAIEDGVEIVMSHDHILGENAERVPFLSQTPPVAQMCAVSGAIQWSLNRGLHLSYWYFGRMSYLVPLYLQSREDITRAPDLIAPIQVNSGSLLVRTVLLPHMPYANARLAVRRHDQLPHWLLDAWNTHASAMSEDQIENPEAIAAD